MITKAQFLNAILPSTLKYEGGYSHISGDRGGETYRGISRNANPTWSGWKFIDNYKFKNVNSVELAKKIPNNKIFTELEGDVADFYYNQYFVNRGFNLLNNTFTALLLFDYAVHGGYSLSKIQSILSKLGLALSETSFNSKVANALNAVNQERLAKEIIANREAHLKSIVAKNPSQQKFWEGWMNRISSLKSKITPTSVGIGLGGMLLIVGGIIFLVKARAKNEN